MWTIWKNVKKSLKSYNILYRKYGRYKKINLMFRYEVEIGGINMLGKVRKALQYTTKKLKRGYENTINIERLEEMQNQGAVIVDVRSEQEFKEGHIEGAISIPEYEIKKRAKKEIPDLGQTIVVYCGTGHRSKRTQKLLEKMGYSQVYNLENGWQNY